MNDNDTTANDTTKPNSHRRSILKALGISGVSLAATGPAAAHPHGPHKNASSNSEISSQETEDEDEDEDGEGHGYGEWCQSVGFGNGMRQGHGYRRNFPHEEDETEWDEWQPGEERPPWAPDENEDEPEADTETYDLTVVVADPDGVPLPEVDVEVSGRANHEFETTAVTTDENGLAQFDLPSGKYTISIDGDTTEFTTPEKTNINVKERDVAVTVTLAEPEEDEEDTDTDVDEPEDEEENEEENEEDEEEPEPTDDATPDEEEQTVANVIEQRINEVTNTYRESQEVPPLDVNDDLATVAREHSEVMATEGSFSHYSPNGDGPGERLDDAGLEYERWAENIAWESGDRIHEPEDDAESIANSVAEGWINSEGHRENILGNYEQIGVGVFIDAEAGEAFVTQLFATLVESPSDGSEDADDGAQSAEEETDG